MASQADAVLKRGITLMKKLLPIILALGLCAAVGFTAGQAADKKSIKKDDAPAEGKTAHKGGSPADKNVIKKDDAPAEGKVGKAGQNAKPPEKKSK
jgi:hypothetical protein